MMSIAIAQRIRSSLPIVQRCLGSQSSLSQMNFSTNAPAKKDNIKEHYHLHLNMSELFIYDRMEAVLEQDNKHEFLKLINSVSSHDLSWVYEFINYVDAANCAAAILAGETGEVLSARAYLEEDGKSPLHAAASSSFSRPRIAALLIDNGFSADVRCDFDSPLFCLKNALPLNVMLEHYGYGLWKRSVRGRKSAIRFITGFCECMVDKTLRVLALNTKEIKHEFFKYLKQGKLAEVGALLAVASDLILSSSTAEGEDDIGFKNILEMHQFLSAEILSASIGASHTDLVLMEMKETLRLLEIFNRIGDKLVSHMQIRDFQSPQDGVMEVASLIQDAGFDVKAEDVCGAPCSFRQNSKSFNSDVLQMGIHDEYRRKGSTKELLPSWLKGGVSHAYTPLPLPKETLVLPYLTMGAGAATKHGFVNKRASFTGAFAKAIRHLRYL